MPSLFTSVCHSNHFICPASLDFRYRQYMRRHTEETTRAMKGAERRIVALHKGRSIAMEVRCWHTHTHAQRWERERERRFPPFPSNDRDAGIICRSPWTATTPPFFLPLVLSRSVTADSGPEYNIYGRGACSWQLSIRNDIAGGEREGRDGRNVYEKRGESYCNSIRRKSRRRRRRSKH